MKDVFNYALNRIQHVEEEDTSFFLLDLLTRGRQINI